MEFKSEELGLTLTLPDDPTRRQLLRYDSKKDFTSDELYERLWAALCAVAKDAVLECEYLSLDDDLDGALGDKRSIEAVKFCSLAGLTWRMSIEDAEKN